MSCERSSLRPPTIRTIIRDSRATRSCPKIRTRPGREPVTDSNGDGKLSYFEAHPEWYGLRKGKRSAKIDGAGDNYCTSNPDATRELAKNLVQSLIDGPWRHVDIVNFWMLDNGKWCECPQCAAQGIYTDRLFDVCYTVQKAIQQAQREKRLHREVLLASLAYHETLPPPARRLPADFDYGHFSVTFFPIERCYVHALADPKCTEINRFLREHYEGWTTRPERNYRGSLFIGEYYNVSSFKCLPVLFPSIMAADIPWYYRTGTRHLNYMHTPTHLWGTWTLNQYLLARLLWDSATDSQAVLQEYFRRYYPTTAERTAQFYRYLEQATANFKTLKHYAGEDIYCLRRRLAVDSHEIFPLKHLRYDAYRPETDDGPDVVEIVEAMRLARQDLDAALLECHDETEAARLLEDERRFAYGEAMVSFYYHLVRTALLHRRQEAALARREFLRVEEWGGKTPPSHGPRRALEEPSRGRCQRDRRLRRHPGHNGLQLLQEEIRGLARLGQPKPTILTQTACFAPYPLLQQVLEGFLAGGTNNNGVRWISVASGRSTLPRFGCVDDMRCRRPRW